MLEEGTLVTDILKLSFSLLMRINSQYFLIELIVGYTLLIFSNERRFLSDTPGSARNRAEPQRDVNDLEYSLHIKTIQNRHSTYNI